MSFEIAIALATVGAAVLAGIAWNTLGIWQVYRERGIAAVDWLKVRKNVIIGVILGIIGYGASLADAIQIPVIWNFESFILGVIAFFPLIIVAEKIFTKKTPGSSVDVAKHV